MPEGAPKSTLHKRYGRSLTFISAGVVFTVEEECDDRLEVVDTKLREIRGQDIGHIEMLLYLADGFDRVSIERASSYGGCYLVDVEGVGAGRDLAILMSRTGVEAVRKAAK